MTLVPTPSKYLTSLPIRTANQLGLHEHETTPWIVPGICAHGTISELIAETYCGKTTLCGCMARSILSGADFLGRSVEKGKILWLTEEGDTTFKPLLERVGISGTPLGDDLAIIGIREFREGLPDWDIVISDVRIEAKELGTSLVIIDVVNTWAQLQDNNDSTEWIRKLRPLQALAADGPGVLLTRHPRKINGRRIETAGSGSNSLTGGCDITLVMEPAFTNLGNSKVPTDDRILKGKGRLPVPAYMHLTTNGDYSQYHLQSNTEPVPVVVDNKQTIRETLRKAGKGLSKGELSKITEIPATSLKRELDAMKDELKEDERTGANHNPEAVYWLR